MSIGSITVDLLAKTGSFETDLGRAAKTAERRAKEIDAAVSRAGAAVGVALGSAAVAAVAFGKSLIDGLDALNDVKDATGASIENLSALEDLGSRTGVAFETVSGILVKFNNGLKEADGKNSVSLALKAIGLDAAELKKVDPAEALRLTAVALAGFADDGNKARLIQELFGKSVKEAAPYLKDLAEQTELVGKVTGEQAQQAEDFNKALFGLQKNAKDAGRALLKDLLPSINEILKAFNSGGLSAGINKFGDELLDWSGNAERKNISNLKKEIESLQGTVERTGRTPGEIVTVRPQDVEDLARLRAALKAAEQGYYKFNAAAGGGRGKVNPDLVDARPTTGDVPTPAKAAKAPKDSEFDKYLENLEKQLQKTKELGVEETVLADLRLGHLKLQKGESADRLIDLAKQIDAAKALDKYNDLSTAAEKARSDVLLKAAEDQEKQAQSLAEGNKSMREEIETIGKSIEAQGAIEKARLSSAIAMKEEERARLQNTDSFARETDAIDKQISLLKERQDLVGQKAVADQLAEDAKKSEEFARSVGAAFESSFEKAVLEGGKLSDVLQGLGKDVLALYLRNNITGPLAKQIGTLGSGSGSADGGFDFSSIVTTVGKWFSGLAFADGGNPPVGKFSVVGENGPELFMPRTAGSIIPNHALGGGGPSVTVHQNFTVGDVASISMVRQAVANSEQRLTSGLRRSRSYAGEAA